MPTFSKTDVRDGGSGSEGGRDTPSQLPDDVYNATLPSWRAYIRSRIVKAVERESPVIARLQARLRSSWLDNYFLYTSSLGTHTFFMIALPILFFFGYPEIGRGLVVVLASGVYFSSFIKDLVCAPRPFAPPVSRLTIGTHHLEYGFPSTHSTNSVSMALFVFNQVHAAYAEYSAISSVVYWILSIILALYAATIVFGRLYLGMHSFTDCAMGVALGTAIWAAYEMTSGEIERWLASGSWSVPSVCIPACLLLVHYHPQPVDDCPCFEDAIAFVSVILGVFLARWHTVFAGLDLALSTAIMPGGQGAIWTLQEKLGWWTLASSKTLLGVLIIFVWRLLAKSVLHAVLPPLFRFLATRFELPRRRFYTPATDYGRLPVENGLRPIPSVIDLPGGLEVSGSGVDGEGRGRGRGAIKRRGVGRGGGGGGVGHLGVDENGDVVAVTENDNDNGNDTENESENEKGLEDKMGGWIEKEVKHYDADVLTKVVVYAGIAMWAGEGMPMLFSLMGWGIRPW